MLQTKSSAILFFSRTVSQEAEEKKFVLKEKTNQRIAEEFIKKTYKTAKKSNLPVFTKYCNSQIGSSFGERLANAVEEVFEKGFRNVIIIGNDCPQLTPHQIQKANYSLSENEVVLGPSHDGGVYLIGLNKATYHREKFINLDWEESTLVESWNQYLSEAKLSSIWLTPLIDIDGKLDLNNFIQENFSPFVKRLQQIISSLFYVEFFFTKNILSKFFLSFEKLRGPPYPVL